MTPSDLQVVSDALQQFHRQAAEIYQEYQRRGPGRLEEALFKGLQQRRQDVERALSMAAPQTSLEAVLHDRCRAWSHAVAEMLDDVTYLGERVVCRSEGLCFVTGEAGLIPRRDLHDRYERRLEELSHLIRWELPR